MKKLIDFNSYPVRDVLQLLLQDKTTKQNIMFATEAYAEIGITPRTPITVDLLLGMDELAIQPRVFKSFEEQAERTRKKAEVFTPSWICNKMNNNCDAVWFGRENVFNTEVEQGWETYIGKIEFPKRKRWQRYVDSKRLEITCGEAPYLVSRYDTTTAEMIPVGNRIGILDRKLRIVRENTESEEDWLKWACRAFESVYGYEFQGDNLLIARINLLMTFVDYLDDRWHRTPTLKELKRSANVIAWNLWQMDGITGTVPYGKPKNDMQQTLFFEFEQGINDTEPESVDCKIHDWRDKRTITYRDIREGRMR
ncbi:MAG: restriction endonuclease subunit M [Clostridium sp.]|nr:restriction endonuclease subunit M [Clostridium sp.]